VVPSLQMLTRTAVLAVCISLGTAPAVLAQSWIGPVVASGVDETGDCRIDVAGNGRFYKLTARGLEPGETARLVLFNEDMRPIERSVRIRGDGSWAEFYMPALPRYRDGVVHAYLTGARCDLEVAFAWRRPTATARSAPDWAGSRFPAD
jgi:hypothetical protein